MILISSSVHFNGSKTSNFDFFKLNYLFENYFAIVVFCVVFLTSFGAINDGVAYFTNDVVIVQRCGAVTTNFFHAKNEFNWRKI
jgi:hypothetical protein